MWRRSKIVIDRWDVAASDRVAAAPVNPAVERGLRMLTRSADRSRLWLAISAVLAASGDSRSRRGAARGLASVAVASLITNQLAKRMVPRRRPSVTSVPVGRLAHRVPTSSSFPSGHSASAAAFAVGVAVEFPELAVPIGALAGAVAFSRVFTGVHYTSDVLAGAAIGATVAGVGKLAVPARSEVPSVVGQAPARPQPPRPDGAGLVAVVNPNSGSGAGGEALRALRESLPAAQIIELTEDDDVVEVMREAAARAEVLGVAGGDGTINAAATAAMAHDIPLLVVPAGTFNHFARDLQLDEIADAIEALQTGRAVRIDVGDVNGEPFLNTASLGSYPEFVRVRERLESKLGKPLAAAVAVVHVFRNCPPLAVEIDGVPRRLEMLFIGNGLYSPRGLRPQWRPRLDSGLLDVRLLDSARYVSRWRLLIGAVTGTLPRSDDYIETRPSQLKVAIDGPPGYLGRDGEVSDAPDVAVFSVRRAALTVYR